MAGTDSARAVGTQESGETVPLLSLRKASLLSGRSDQFQDVPLDLYSTTVFLSIWDLFVSKTRPQKNPSGIRVMRIIIGHLLLLLLVVLQIGLLVKIKQMVCSPSVRAIRNVYDEYQMVMYAGFVRDTGYGFRIGLGGPDGPYFHRENFEKLDADFKSTLCQFPFAQRDFLFILLLVWTLTVVGELQGPLHDLIWICKIKTASLNHCVEEMAHDEDPFFAIVGLPCWLKIWLVALYSVRMLVAFVLLWLGCRWLASTTDLGNVLSNAVALEFVLALNHLLFDKLIFEPNKVEMRRLRMELPWKGRKKDEDSRAFHDYAWDFHAGLLCGVFAILWVYFYIFHFQMVLPYYQWDVKGPCTAWASERFSFWRV
mmetsp:Transcript_16887/g.39672  ORF Transcript_16887/g.39672 Transcript_16887/m.39672 type:complete len:370 (-) Transcript_16887:123-1232(-)